MAQQPGNGRARYTQHYHITMISEEHGTASEMTTNYDESRLKFDKTVQTLKDLSGLEPIESDHYHAVFDGNNVVRWRPCIKDCVDASQ